MKSRRNMIEISSEILSAAIEDISKTAIVYRANLNFKRAEKYLDKLLELGLMTVSEKSALKYKTAKKGRDFLIAYENLKKEYM